MPCPLPPPAVLLEQGLSPSLKWQTREGAFKLLTGLAASAPTAVGAHLPDLVPIITENMVDPREQVKEASKEAGAAAFAQMGNNDIAHLVRPRGAQPTTIACIPRNRAAPLHAVGMHVTDVGPCGAAPAGAMAEGWGALASVQVPDLLACIAKPEETASTVAKLSAATFVQVRAAAGAALAVSAAVSVLPRLWLHWWESGSCFIGGRPAAAVARVC